MTKLNLPCSLIITTYNWPAALDKVLQSVLWQTILPREVIIADDGSKDETKELVATISNNFPVPIIWVWHEDDGKRKTRINNIAISKSTTDYLIFIDHDILLHPNFIEDHLQVAEPEYFLNGSRFLINESSTNELMQKKIITPEDLKQLKGKNALNRKRIPYLMKLLAHHYQTKGVDNFKVRGCNMSFWKKDLIAVNGFDESYKGWGREDSNIAARLYYSGIHKKSLKFGGIAYHLNHKEANKKDDDVYMEMLLSSIHNKETWAETGLNQHMQ
ncbi:MAG: glycosyltransferase [Sphingobacteriales bacterium]|nr:MAG: glycosyltransferase [Sphingobacteriales bacterium]